MFIERDELDRLYPGTPVPGFPTPGTNGPPCRNVRKLLHHKELDGLPVIGGSAACGRRSLDVRYPTSPIAGAEWPATA